MTSVNRQEQTISSMACRQAAQDSDSRVPLARIFRSPSIWMLFVGWFCFNSLWYGFLTWVPSFLAKTQGLNIGALGWASFLVFFAGFVGELTGGQLLDYWLRTSGATEKVYRRLFGISAGLATIAVFLVAYVHQQAAVITLLATTLFFLRWCGMYWTLPALADWRREGRLPRWLHELRWKHLRHRRAGHRRPDRQRHRIILSGVDGLCRRRRRPVLCSVGMRYRRAV